MPRLCSGGFVIPLFCVEGFVIPYLLLNHGGGWLRIKNPLLTSVGLQIRLNGWEIVGESALCV